MSNENGSNLNVILGQLEDELRSIKSAREQADGVVSANSELSARLERVVAETRGLVEESNDRTRAATESLAIEVGRMSEQSEAIKKAADDAVDKVSNQISELSDQALSSLNEGIEEAKGELSTAAEAAKTAASEIKASNEALLEANETAKSENKQQIEETRALLEGAQKHLVDIEESIATLKTIDVDALAEEIRGLRTEEADNIAILKNQLTKVMIVAGSSAVMCLIVMIKLFIG